MPLWIGDITQARGPVSIHWYGGSGLYQVQRRKDLDKGKWHNVGHPTTALSFTNKMTHQPAFYRVQSLPNP
jgi:hypothetical protein